MENENFPEIELTILMPCLNEAETIVTCLRKAESFLRAEGISGEILVADNGSVDGSQELARQNGARVIDVPIRGYGAALTEGSLSARGKFIVMGDADDSYDFSVLSPFLQKLREGYDLVMGNRFQGGIQDGAMPWKNRYIGNPVLSGMGKLFFSVKIGDFHCGLRGYSRKAFESMHLRTTGMEFASEMVIKASLNDLRIAEVPIKLYPDGRARKPHLRPWRDGWRHLRFMLMLSPRWLFLYPGLCLMLIGSVLSAQLFSGPIHIFGLTWDIHTLLFATTSILLGFQMFSLAILLRQYGARAGVLKQDNWDRICVSFFKLEKGILMAVLFCGSGILFSLLSLVGWRAVGLGDIVDVSQSFRDIIPAVLCFSLGLQILLTSCALSATEFLGGTEIRPEMTLSDRLSKVQKTAPRSEMQD